MSDPGSLQSPPGSISDNMIVNNQSTGSSFVQSEPHPHPGPAGGAFGSFLFVQPTRPRVQAAEGSAF